MQPITRLKSVRLARANAMVVADVMAAVLRHRTPWLLPLVIVLLIIGGTLVAAASLGPLAPFIYPLL